MEQREQLTAAEVPPTQTLDLRVRPNGLKRLTPCVWCMGTLTQTAHLKRQPVRLGQQGLEVRQEILRAHR